MNCHAPSVEQIHTEVSLCALRLEQMRLDPIEAAEVMLLFGAHWEASVTGLMTTAERLRDLADNIEHRSRKKC